MHCVQTLSVKVAVRPRATVVATPLSGRGRQRPCSIEFSGRPSQSSLVAELPSIFSRKLYSILPAISHIPRAAKVDDAIAQPDAPADPYMPEEWPDFSNKKVDPGIDKRFYNRNGEYNEIVEHVSLEPEQPLLLLGPVDSGKTVSHAIAS